MKRCHPSRRQPLERVPRQRLRGAIALLSTAAVVAAAGLSASVADARVLLVGSWRGHHGSFKSIQAAVDSARSGDWILVGPGDYHERGDRDRRYRSLAEQGAGVMITKPRLHLRGMNRNRVVIDGTKPGASRCSRAGSDQDFGPHVGGKANGRNGVEVFKTPGVTVENLTACNFLEGEGSSGNQIWFNFGDGSRQEHPGLVPGRLPQRDLDVLRDRQASRLVRDLLEQQPGPGNIRAHLREQHERLELLHRGVQRLQPGAHRRPCAVQRPRLLRHQRRRPLGRAELRVGPQPVRDRHQQPEQ